MPRTLVFALLAMVAFASNSVLCRAALGTAGRVDPASYTAIRLLSGAILLSLLSRPRGTTASTQTSKAGWLSASLLYTYAVTFSYAYTQLPTATGALILFGTVQLTIICFAVSRGEKPHPLEWSGLVVAFSGLVYLLSSDLSTPSIRGSALMLTSGVAWGFYTIRGRGSKRPVADTSINFRWSVPFVILTSLIAISDTEITGAGASYAIVSGALASGLGYVAWYAALPGLSGAQAGIVQLAVPAVTALGGMLILSEDISSRTLSASLFILGGVGLSTLGPKFFMRRAN